MDITPYVEHLRRDLLAAAEGSGEETRRVAERLGFALDPAARLALMEAISQAAAEITAEMPAGGVDVRLDGRDLAFVVEGGATVAPPAAPMPPPPPPPPAPGDELAEDGVARVSLRLPESVKARAEEAAAQAGQSLNTWLVNAVRSATQQDPAVRVDVDLSSIPTGDGFPFGGRSPGGRGRRMTGWA